GGDGRVGAEVLPERLLSAVAPQQIERGEVGQLQAVEEDERGLDAAVGQEEAPVELRQGASMACHGATDCHPPAGAATGAGIRGSRRRAAWPTRSRACR